MAAASGAWHPNTQDHWTRWPTTPALPEGRPCGEGGACLGSLMLLAPAPRPPRPPLLHAADDAICHHSHGQLPDQRCRRPRRVRRDRRSNNQGRRCRSYSDRCDRRSNNQGRRCRSYSDRCDRRRGRRRSWCRDPPHRTVTASRRRLAYWQPGRAWLSPRQPPACSSEVAPSKFACPPSPSC